MAIESVLSTISKVANADLSGSQFCGVILDNTGQLVLPGSGGANKNIFGVLQDKPTLGRAGVVAFGGETKMLVGTGGIAAGGNVSVDANGAAVAQSGSNTIVGVCTIAGAAGQIGSVMLKLGQSA